MRDRPYAYLDAIANHGTVSISAYNTLLTLYMARGDEITRLKAVIRNVVHYLTAKQDVQGLSAVEDALLLELVRVMEVSA